VGHLLKEGLLDAPLQPHSTALGPGLDAATLTWPPHLPPTRPRPRLLLAGLPRRAQGVAGAAAVLALLDDFGGAVELRGGGGPGSRLWATLRGRESAEAAVAALRDAEAPPWLLGEDEAAEAEAARRNRRLANNAGESGCRVFVGNLAASVREDALWELFGECGYIAEVRLATDGEGWCRGFAHVHFEGAEGAAQAVRLSGALVEEQSVRVERASDEADEWDEEEEFGWLEARFGAGRRAPPPPPPQEQAEPQQPQRQLQGEVLEEAEIKEALIRREELRKARDFEGADALRQGLWEAGVRVDDKRREWSCMRSGRTGPIESLVESWLGGANDEMRGGRRGGRGDERRGDGGRGGGGGGGGGGGEMPEVEIKEALVRREQLRKARDFAGADAVREELWEAGVKVDDGRQEWRCRASGRFGSFELHSRKRSEGEEGARRNPNRRQYD
jgi:hypothetical protein